MLTRVHYDALDYQSSALLLEQLKWCQKRGREFAYLYTSYGSCVAVPTWALACCLAERQEEEDGPSDG